MWVDLLQSICKTAYLGGGLQAGCQAAAATEAKSLSQLQHCLLAALQVSCGVQDNTCKQYGPCCADQCICGWAAQLNWHCKQGGVLHTGLLVQQCQQLV
jgi:hypothetical protein